MLPEISCKTFNQKPASKQQIIRESLDILIKFGIRFSDMTPRRLEMMSMCFLAVCDVNSPGGWERAKCFSDNYSLRSRDIIDYINENFGEHISKGSYDDIRRKHLLRPVDAKIIVRTIPASSRNNPTRRYALSDSYAAVVRAYGTGDWEGMLKTILLGKTTQTEAYAQDHNLPTMPVRIPDGKKIALHPDPHNVLQKDIIEKFLPKFGFDSELLYIGDADNKYLVYQKDKLEDIGFFNLNHAELPDVIAYSERKNLLFLIEAFHSTGAITIDRLSNLKRLTENCKAKIVFITAFADFKIFIKHSRKIAWDTEIWIAEIPEHMIHYNGPKFLDLAPTR